MVNNVSIQKKSLISTLKTTKKANVAKEEFEPISTSSVKSPARMLAQKGGVKSPARLLANKGGVKSPARMLAQKGGVKSPARLLAKKS
jgi:hypothetical protein